MITIRDKDTKMVLGSISEDELQTLIDALEEESSDDTDYYIDAPTIDLLEQQDVSANLIAFLRRALGPREGMEIEWSR
jgi:processive 1,2-diacylglycerol beta-glucosyltransferase